MGCSALLYHFFVGAVVLWGKRGKDWKALERDFCFSYNKEEGLGFRMIWHVPLQLSRRNTRNCGDRLLILIVECCCCRAGPGVYGMPEIRTPV